MIDKQIPVPDSYMNGNTHARKYPFPELQEIGDSFFWPCARNLLAASANRYHEKTGNIYACRVDEKDGVKGSRCWLIKKAKPE